MSITGIILIFGLFISLAFAADTNVVRVTLDKEITLSFTLEKFNKADIKLTDCGGGYICLIDNRPFWGSDGAIPTENLTNLQMDLKGRKVNLDTSGMYNPKVIKEDASRYQVINYYDDVWKVRGKFSDGGAVYYAEWLVVNGQSMRVVIGGTELLYDAFDHIFKKNN